MPSLRVATLHGTSTAVDDQSLADLSRDISGGLLTRDSPGFDEARRIWNASIDRRPAMIARCRTAADVQQAVRFAAAHDVLVSVKGGGHNIAGNAVCSDGLMIDLSLMKGVTIDRAARTAVVEPGVTLAEFDGAAQQHGLATPLGINSTTGVAGLTLGGGFGWLSRKYGLTIDNLRSAQIVTADGELRELNDRINPDLFWAIRGGGGNFGIVTKFDYQLHPVGPEVLAGLIVHPFASIKAVIQQYRQVVASAPDELCCWVVVRKAPPLPFLPEAWHGREVVVLAAVYSGEITDGERHLAPLRSFGTPIADVIGPAPYAGFQQAFDPLLTPGARNYWKSHDLQAISDGAIEGIVEYAGRLPSPGCEIFIAHLGGAVNRVQPDATAFGRRDFEFVLNVHTRWDQPADDARCIAWAREFFTAMAPHALGSVYLNFMPDDEPDRVQSAFGPNFPRLAAIKAKYDPKNLFRMNQNIQPATV
jgi:FAD/FMN-containing dehydrogenase